MLGLAVHAWIYRPLADPRDVTTGFVRNGFGEPIQETSPDRGTTVYVRDAAGNVTRRTDASFDALDRQLALTFPATPALNRGFSYDATAGGNKGVGRLTGRTERVSVSASGTQGNSGGEEPAISGDGRSVAFVSFSTNLVPGDTNKAGDIFVRTR